MTQNYITLSLETHLFFLRIMKEYALFLEAGFPCKNKEWIEHADHVPREANHYTRILQCVRTGEGC